MLTQEFLKRMQTHCKAVQETNSCLNCKFPQYCNVISYMKSDYTIMPKDFNDEIISEILGFEKTLTEICSKF